MKKINSDLKRVIRNRKRLKNVNVDRYRITVAKSLKNISAQIIDDKINKVDMSTVIGELLAKRAMDKKISKVYFDRGGYKYHGRVKALADSLRKNGLSF